MMIVAAVIFWVICGIIAYGCEFAYWQREWPEIAKDDVVADRWFSLFSAILGPLSLIHHFFSYNLHGIMFFPNRECSMESFILSPGEET